MLQTGLASAAVLAEGRHRRMDLVGQEAQHQRRDGFTGAQDEPWVTQERQLHRSPKLIGPALPSFIQFKSSGESVQ